MRTFVALTSRPEWSLRKSLRLVDAIRSVRIVFMRSSHGFMSRTNALDRSARRPECAMDEVERLSHRSICAAHACERFLRDFDQRVRVSERSTNLLLGFTDAAVGLGRHLQRSTGALAKPTNVFQSLRDAIVR